jgi:hypothetical protein
LRRVSNCALFETKESLTRFKNGLTQIKNATILE